MPGHAPSIFRFGLGIGDGDGANQSLFYSRRVGRAPQGRAHPQGGWVDRPAESRILGAWKLSGKTSNGWSVGVLNAVTGREDARVATVSGERHSTAVEPLTNYAVTRVQRDFRNGNSALGAVATGVNREEVVAHDLGLRTGAYTGGVDARHRFGDGHIQLNVNLLASHVRGSTGAIEATQRSPIRYYQRPDAPHLSLDPTRTSLSGWSSTLELWKMGGGNWRWATGTQWRSPGFEANDAGFMTEGDFRAVFGFVGYVQNEPGKHLRSWRVNTSAWSNWTFGNEHTSLGGNVNGNVQFMNNWSAYGGINRQAEGLSTTQLRGGPAMVREASWNGWSGLNTDDRKAVQGNLGFNWNVRPESNSHSWNTNANLRWNPSSQIQLRAGPFVSRRVEDQQWGGLITTEAGPHYLLGRLDQTTVGMTARADLAISPTLTLQLYAQPFLSSGDYGEFKEVVAPRSELYQDRFRLLETQEDGRLYRVDLNGDGPLESFANPDFRVGQFRSNLVLRWEYRPGSTLFLVWAQARDDFQARGEFQLGDGVSDLFGHQPENVFMVKFNYWLTP
ncbi:MAG: DUF5916 domain-containing protein [Gemmatimonadota bacterium]